jgi:hypothetical protein
LVFISVRKHSPHHIQFMVAQNAVTFAVHWKMDTISRLYVNAKRVVQLLIMDVILRYQAS